MCPETRSPCQQQCHPGDCKRRPVPSGAAGEHYSGAHPDCRCAELPKEVNYTGCECPENRLPDSQAPYPGMLDERRHQTCLRCDGAIYPPYQHGIRVWSGQGQSRCLCGCGNTYPGLAN